MAALAARCAGGRWNMEVCAFTVHGREGMAPVLTTPARMPAALMLAASAAGSAAAGRPEALSHEEKGACPRPALLPPDFAPAESYSEEIERIGNEF